MKTSQKGIELIKQFEGFRNVAYKCSAGVLTIGYGHTKGVKRGMCCTQPQAEEWLREDIEWAEKVINDEGVALSQNQFDALVSFVFNVGSKNWKNSTLRRLVRENTYSAHIKGAFRMWNKAKVDGVLREIHGLTNRRLAEAELYYQV